jgi:hypothetical protein
MLSGHTRHDSMVMDMDLDNVISEPASESSTFPPNAQDPRTGVDEVEDGNEKVENVEVVQPRKMGNLMKEMKQDVQQGGMEFNMDSFF